MALGILFAGPIVALFANGFKATPGKFELTVRLTRWMFPYILLVSAAALLEAYLNSKGFFQLSAATPIAWNLAIVAAAWALAPAGVSPLAALTVGVLVGGFLQVALQGPAVRRLGLRFSGSPFRDTEVKRTALQIAPRLYGYGVGQLSFLVSTRTLAALGDAFVTYNFCAWRVTDFVLGGFVVSLTRTILPSLSDQALEKDRTAYTATIAFALRLIGFVTIPSTVGPRAARDAARRRRLPTRALRDGRRRQDGARGRLLRARPLRGGGREDRRRRRSTRSTTRRRRSSWPRSISPSSGCCVSLSPGRCSHAGVALATSAGFWINFLALLALLRKRLGRLGGRAVGAGLLRLTLASLGMGAIVWAVSERLVPYRMAWGLPLRIGWVGAVASLGAVAFRRLREAPRRAGSGRGARRVSEEAGGVSAGQRADPAPLGSSTPLTRSLSPYMVTICQR